MREKIGFLGKKIIFWKKKNAIEVRNRKKTVFSTDEKKSILGAQSIKIFGFLGEFVS